MRMLFCLIIRCSLFRTRVRLAQKPSNSVGSGGCRLLESNRARHAQLDLSAVRDPTRKAKSRTDSFGPLAHPLQTPVSITSPLQYLRSNAATVVAHDDAQFGGPILDLHFDLCRVRMAAGIDNRLAANTINFVTQPCSQTSFPAMNNHAKVDR